MQRGTLLGRQQIHALRALVALARDPEAWRSVTSLAEQQDLPAAMLEQLLLRLRRSGLLEARRGRLGGYRLRQAAAAINITMVLRALALEAEAPGDPTRQTSGRPPGDSSPAPRHSPGAAAERPAATPEPKGEPIPAHQTASEQVAAALERRLQRALERELSRISLEDLLFDLRSSEAGLEEEGGLMLP